MTAAPSRPTAAPPEPTGSPRDRAVHAFAARFGAAPSAVARAPGRVNLIGEHTDYNDGFVLPMAIDRAAWIAFRPRDDDRVTVQALDFGGATDEFALADVRGGRHVGGRGPGADAEGDWAEYVRGMAWSMADAGLAVTRGWDGVVAGDIPVGAGLSSSAGLEVAAARAFAHASGLEWQATRMAQLAQRAENVWVGVNSGIMDQLISAEGRDGHAMLMDCRSLALRPVPVPPEVAVVVLDTATRRGLVDSAYNERRAQCEAAARHFGVPALRDVDEAAFAARAHELDDVTRRRARHVVTENARTLAAADAFARGDVAEAGRLMDASHASLRDDFEVSRAELDAIVEISRAHPGCHGARMTGAGFGGCGVALVARDAAPEFATAVAQQYEAAVGLRPAVYVCSASQGAALE